MLKRRARAWVLLLLLLLGVIPAGALAFSGWKADREYRSQLDLVRAHLREVVISDTPSAQWLAARDAPSESPSFSKERAFLFLKVWLAASAVDEKALELISLHGPELRSRPPYLSLVRPPHSDEEGMHLELDVGSSRGPLRASIKGNGTSASIFVGLSSLSDCMFDPDWDQDGDIDLDDVEKARREVRR